MNWFPLFNISWPEGFTWAAFLSAAVTAFTISWILVVKKDSTSAVAWCLTVALLPLVGPILFVLFGYQHVSRPLSRKRRQKQTFRFNQPPTVAEHGEAGEPPEPASPWQDLERLAVRFDGFPALPGNRVTLYHEGPPAFDAMLEAMRSARHHIHVEFYIFQPDEAGRTVLELLVQKAREGVEVRVLYDAMGSRKLHRRLLSPLGQAGGRSGAFLPINPLRRRIQVNLRNHRKILVIDGRVGFTGGMNIGDEYLGKVARFGYWRDTHVRLEGPAVGALQRVFLEDWDFASGEHLKGLSYFPHARPAGEGQAGEEKLHRVQVIQSGPDQELKSIREIYFAAILSARQRLWIATPYFVPDAGIRDALWLAGQRGIDVRILGLFQPDKWIPYFAGRYHWATMLEAGVKVYQYTRGMMHSKVMLVDGHWASVGSANLDNRSLHLNFELNCLLDSPEVVAELEGAFRQDLETAIRLDRDVYARRPFVSRLVENACRLMSPVL